MHAARSANLIIFIGRDAEGKETIVSICAITDNTRDVMKAIFEGWPATVSIDRYTVTASGEPDYSVTREELEKR